MTDIDPTGEESPQSCVGCIFFNDKTMRDFGVTSCAAKWIPLAPLFAMEDEPRLEAIYQERARGCDKFASVDSAPAVDIPDSIDFLKVADQLPAPESMMGRVRTGNCFSCANYVSGDTMAESLGITTAGGCRPMGLIMRNGSSTDMPRVCGTHAAVGPRTPIAEAGPGSWAVDPLLTRAHVYSMKVEAVALGPVKIVEPTTYETDAPVTDEDKALGIRAWRNVWSESGASKKGKGTRVLLPVFDLDFFTEEERAAIPRTGDDELPEQYIDHQGMTYKAAVIWRHLNETPALTGQAGTGKTEFFRYMAWLMCLPFHRISVTGSTEVEDLAGKMHYEPSRGTYFEYGRIPRAWTKPGVICLDEPNVGPPDVWQFIRPLTDNSKQLVLDMNNGERVERHPNAFLGMAMNPSWDVRNSGTTQLADADGSRLMHIFVPMPNEETERKIIARRCLVDGYEIPEDLLDAVIKIAADIRAQSDEDALPITWGVRQQIKVARALRWFDLPTAYRLAAADYLDEEAQVAILDIVKAGNPALASRGRGRKAYDF